jgi:hypothetical protein
MTKVLALLTLAVLAFSAMTGPAFAPPLNGRSGVRVEQNLGAQRLESWNQPKNTTQEWNWKGLWKGYIDDPSRLPGSLDNGIPNRF